MSPPSQDSPIARAFRQVLSQSQVLAALLPSWSPWDSGLETLYARRSVRATFGLVSTRSMLPLGWSVRDGQRRRAALLQSTLLIARAHRATTHDGRRRHSRRRRLPPLGQGTLQARAAAQDHPFYDSGNQLEMNAAREERTTALTELCVGAVALSPGKSTQSGTRLTGTLPSRDGSSAIPRQDRLPAARRHLLNCAAASRAGLPVFQRTG